MSRRRFLVIDLGIQIDGQRRFAVWDLSVARFWKINNRQTWMYVDELVADFTAVFPEKREAQTTFLIQRDEIVEQAFALCFDRDVA